MAPSLWHRALYRRDPLLEPGRPLHQIPRPRGSRRGAAGNHRPRDDGRALCRRCSECGQPRKDPTEFGVVSIGAIHGGTAANIIPDDVVLSGTIRSFKPEVRAKMLAGIERTAKAVAAVSNAPEPEIKITEGVKAVINDPGVVATAEKVLKAAFGDKFRSSPPVTVSEDYSEFINAGVPSMFFNIGVYEPERVAAAREGEGPQLPTNHSPLFAPVPKPTIETGVEAMTFAVLSVFDQRAREK
jgi:metal-dependent amidase/aminoacylase/carboxypeptidase family protein